MSKDKPSKKDKLRKYDLFSIMLEQSSVFRSMVERFQGAFGLAHGQADAVVFAEPVVKTSKPRKGVKTSKRAKGMANAKSAVAKKPATRPAKVATEAAPSTKPAAAAKKTTAKKAPAPAKSAASKPASKPARKKTSARPAKKVAASKSAASGN